MARSISLEIVTPEKLVLKDEAGFVVLPACEGELGVLPGHAPLLVQLKVGELRITRDDQVRFFAVSGGFAEVRPSKVSVFAETAEMGEEIDVERARLAAEKARMTLSNASGLEDEAKARAALMRALLRLRVSEGLSKRRRK